MSALPQPDFSNFDSFKELPSPQPTKQTNNSTVVSRGKNYQKTTRLSPKKRTSATLQLLKSLQRCTSGFAVMMVLGSIAVYLSTVRIPQLWSQEYETLEALQRQERDLVAADEALKYEIARQAEESELAMSAISPENTMFLKPIAVSPQVAETDVTETTLNRVNRLGY